MADGLAGARVNPVVRGPTASDGVRAREPAQPGSTERSLDRTIGRVLQWGIAASMALLVAGVLLMIAGRVDPLGPPPLPFDPAGLVRGLVTLQPEAYLWLGLIVTIATPSLRVLASLVGYGRAGDRRMVLVSVGILTVIAASVAIANMVA